MTAPAAADVLGDLAPTGTLRAGINLGNPLLVTGRGADGAPTGVAPDIAASVAAALGVPLALVPYPTPTAVADDVDADRWDIGLIGAEPQRARRIDFTAPYVEIEATYLVGAAMGFGSIDDVDRAGVRIASAAGAAYTLWLERNLRHAALVTAEGLSGATGLLAAGRADVLAGLRTALTADAAALPGSRVLDGRFSSVQQAIGVAKGKAAGLRFLSRIVADLCASGAVADLIARHGASGLSVPAPAEGDNGTPL